MHPIPASVRCFICLLCKSWIFCSLLLLLVKDAGAQSMARKDCLHPTIVRFTTGGARILSEEGILSYDSTEQVMVNYHAENTESKWYEFIAEYDFTLSFKIWSDNPVSRYGFFIYKKGSGPFFCEDLSRGKVKPIESVIYKNEVGLLGLGILPSYNAELDDTSRYDRSKLLYDIPYKNAIKAHRGDTFYLNVYRYAENDCGHHIWITTGSETTKIRCINTSCEKVEPLRRIQVTPFYDSAEHWLAEYMKAMNKPKPFIAELEVTDSASGKPVRAQLYHHLDESYSTRLADMDESGKSTLTLNRDTTFLVYRMGYHPQKVQFTREGNHFARISLKRIKRGEQFILEHIYFKTNSNQILLTSRPEIGKLAQFLQDNPKYKIEVQGHTNGQSRIRKDKHNKKQFHGTEKKLSRLRALAVKEELKHFGIESKRVRIKGYGGEKMLYPFPKNTMEHDRNKRVEVVVL